MLSRVLPGKTHSTTLAVNHAADLRIAVVEPACIGNNNNNIGSSTIIFNIIIQDAECDRSLERNLQDFIDFHEKIKPIYPRKSKIQFPHIKKYQSKSATFKRKCKRTIKQLSCIPLSTKPLCEKLEEYLYQCALDSRIRQTIHYKEFVSAQRQSDHIISKKQQQHTTLAPTTCLTVSSSKISRSSRLSILVPSKPSRSTSLSSSSISTPFSSLNTMPPQLCADSFYNDTDDDEDDASSVSSAYDDQGPAKMSIEDFQIIKVLGKGCMGKVLLVRHCHSQKLLALKAISKDRVITQREIEHTRMERDILTTIAKVRHPFLVRLHYALQDPKQLFLAVDYHIGGDLATQLAKFVKFSPKRCLLYSAEILLGLQELHRLGILYRDLKPENILLAADGHLVLTDFGLSKQFYQGGHRTGTFCGTAEYMAPEILLAKEYSYAVDYWSLGTIMYEMMTGVTPFWAETHAEMYARVLQDPLEFPEDFDPIAADLISGFLEREPHLRLGAGIDGPNSVRSHPYFAHLNWSDVYNKRIRPPYIPQYSSETDVRNFDPEFIKMTPRLSPVNHDSVLEQQFHGYSFINESILSSRSRPSSPCYSLKSINEQHRSLSNLWRQQQNNNQQNRTLFNDSDLALYDAYTESDIMSHDDDLFISSFEDPSPPPKGLYMSHYYGARRINLNAIRV